MSEEKETGVQAVKRALKIIELLGRKNEEWGVTELGKELGLHKSTIHRLLITMVEEGFVEQLASGKYQLGPKVLEIGGRALSNLEIRKIAMPYIMELSQQVGETVHLVILQGGEGIYIDKVEADNRIRMHSNIGARVKLHCSAVGKSMLANLTSKEVKDIIARHGLPVLTTKTITTPEELKEELARVKLRGYAIDDEENEYGIRCVAAAVLDYAEKPVAAISISGPTMRVTKERVGELGEKVKATALLISLRLGYHP